MRTFFLECGILAHGFLRLRCADCADEKLVAFSCKRRGFGEVERISAHYGTYLQIRPKAANARAAWELRTSARYRLQ